MSISIKNNQFFLNGKPFFIYSGEIHYFRIPKKEWPLHIRRAKQARLNTISSYIPWLWHEYENGKFDFAGQTYPERDFITFLKLLKENGLYFIARIGPVSNAELVNEGLPQWLIKTHPEICISGKGLPNLPHITLISYHNPIYKKYVKRWYSEVLPIIKENQISNNGNIILVQLCNEIGMVHWVNKMPDYSCYTEQLYQQFLKEKYYDVSKINKVYNSKYNSFNEIHQPQEKVDTSMNHTIVKYIDWMYFYSWYYALYFKFLYDVYKEYKIELPVIANIPQFYDFDVRGRGVYSPMTTVMFREFSKFVSDIIFGGAYQMRQLDFENFHDILITTEIVKMISVEDNPVICCELQTGILKDRPKLYSSDVELNLKTSTSSGINGINCYMFSGGRNLKEIGVFGRYHEWQSPVNSSGEVRNHFQPIKNFGMLIETFGEKLSSTKKLTDTTVGFYPPYYTTELLKGEYIEDLEIKRTLFFFDGVCRLLQLGGFNFDIVDIETVSDDKLAKIPHLWFFSLDFIDEEVQQKLVKYVINGGKLIMGPQVPQSLAEKFNLKIKTVSNENLVFINNREVYTSSKVQLFVSDFGSKVIAKTKSGDCCGIMKNIGKGKVIIYGFGLTHFFDYHIDVIKYFANLLDIHSKIVVNPEDLQTVVRINNNYGFLFLFNYHNEDRHANLTLKLPWEKKKIKIPSKGKIYLAKRTAKVLPLNFPLSQDIKIKYSTDEILKFSLNNKMLTFHLTSFKDTFSELLIETYKRPKWIKVNREKIKYNYKFPYLQLQFLSRDESSVVLIRF